MVQKLERSGRWNKASTEWICFQQVSRLYGRHDPVDPHH